MEPLLAGTDWGQSRLKILRITLALLICAHGWERIFTGGISTLGAELTDFGLPLGQSLAILVTIAEACGALVFAWGIQVLPLSILYMVIYAAAIKIHHAKFGWYASGSDDNGCEYAVLLMMGFFSQAAANIPQFKASLTRPIGVTRGWQAKLIADLRSSALGGDHTQIAFNILTFTLATLISTHGWHRFLTGGWLEWGHDMSARGYPLGTLLAGGITALEAVGAPLFGMGILAFPLSLMFATLYTVAIFLHHLRSGWFMADGGWRMAARMVLNTQCFW